MMNHPPIPITELENHIENLKASDGQKFSAEYESIEPGQQFTWDHSNMEVNKSKNRYANVIAYDHSRVVLPLLDGELGSDYINANFMDGYRKHNAYIATQVRQCIMFVLFLEHNTFSLTRTFTFDMCVDGIETEAEDANEHPISLVNFSLQQQHKSCCYFVTVIAEPDMAKYIYVATVNFIIFFRCDQTCVLARIRNPNMRTLYPFYHHKHQRSVHVDFRAHYRRHLGISGECFGSKDQPQ